MKQPSTLLTISVTILLTGIAGWGVFQYWLHMPTTAISFESCTKERGSTMLLLYPGRCITRDGKSFTQQLTDEEKKNLLPPVDTSGWKLQTIDELGMTFSLPPIMSGNFTRVSTPSETGKQLCWAMDMPQGLRIVPRVFAGGGSCGVTSFTVGATTPDHTAGREGGFADIKKFAPLADTPASLITQFTNSNGVEIIKIIGKDTQQTDPTLPNWNVIGTPGSGVIGAIIQTKNAPYTAYTMQIKLTDGRTELFFDQILDSIALR